MWKGLHGQHAGIVRKVDHGRLAEPIIWETSPISIFSDQSDKTGVQFRWGPVTLKIPQILHCSRTLTLVLDPSDYAESAGSKCDIHLSSIELSQKPDMWVLGQPVLRKYVSVYDLPRRRVGFALSPRQKLRKGSPRSSRQQVTV